jgi:hypothetical protein
LNLPKTKKEAVTAGSPFYYTGNPCTKGHLDKRYTSSSQCLTCSENWKADNKERLAQSKKKWRRNNLEKAKESSRRWQEKSGQNKAWDATHPEQRRIIARAYYKKRKADPLFRLYKNTRKSVWESLKQIKGGRSWEILVGFTLEELKQHLESKFTGEMTWENYGITWEVDHIKPLAACSSFHEAWQLNNLQPLPPSVNRSKGANYSSS